MSREKPLEIRKHPDCAPGTWWWTDGDAGPTVSCPGCQALHMIENRDGLGHDVAQDGTVTPSVGCTRCKFHDWIKLGSWEPARSK